MSVGSQVLNLDTFNLKRLEAYTFQQIFDDNFQSFVIDNPELNIRPIVSEEVEKMINCQKPELGHAIYECSDCHEIFCVPFTCKSRFCNTCALKYQQDRALEISSKLINCVHRHMVFTIPEELRYYFQKYRDKLLNSLFKAVEKTIKEYFYSKDKSKKLTPGIVLVLHTFGKDLKWNPHIHTLVTEGGSSNIKICTDSDVWIKVDYLSYAFFRKYFRKHLIKLMKQQLSTLLSDKDFNKFNKLCNYLYNTYEEGFYVRAKPPFNANSDKAVKYLIRYFNRPSMAQSHILYYDGTYVIFYYQRHEDDKYVIEKLHVYELFKRLIIHIPEKYFKMLRYAGIYSSHKCTQFNKLIKKMSDVAIKTAKLLSSWAHRIEMSFHYDPLICPFCGNSTMSFSGLYIAHSPP